MATYHTITMELPVHWACALLYGDDTGFEKEDQAHYDAQPYGVLACNVTEMVFTVTNHATTKEA